MPLDSAQNRPRILFVTSHWPLAGAYGAQQRVLNIAKLLRRIGDVSFVIVPTELEDPETVRRSEREFGACKVIRPAHAGTRALVRLSERFRHEFDRTYMATDPYIVSASDRKTLEELMRQHDMTWVHTVRTANWFRIFEWPNAVLDVDDLPSRLLTSAADAATDLTGRMLNLRRAWIWRRRESVLTQRFSALAVCSENDRQYLGAKECIHVIPNGAHPQPGNWKPSPEPCLGLIGNCTFRPNEEGLKWFIQNSWPAIKSKFPNAQLRLVGRGSQGYLTTLGPDIVGLGWMEDPAEEIARWSAMIVPIQLGSGTRVKLAEGFARRCPVVTTSMGAFGYDDVENGREILLADRADDFAAGCIRLMSDPEMGAALADRAYQLFLNRWTWDSFGGRVDSIVRDCLARADRSRKQ